MKILYDGFKAHVLLVVVLLNSTTSCKKLADVKPPITATTGESAYLEDATAAAVLSGVYADMSSSSFSGRNGISVLSGLSADELGLFKTTADIRLNLFFKNALSSQEDVGPWRTMYNYLYTANSAIEGLAKSTSLTPAVKKQLEGEAKFIRAFFHFYLVNLYGDVPLMLTKDYRVNATSSRTPKEKVYTQIIDDLKAAQSLLSEQYLSADGKRTTLDRVRPTKWAAMALLARVYLYTKDWIQAEAQATTVINNTIMYNMVGLNEVFLKNNQEAIWQLQPVDQGWNTWDARVFIPIAGINNDYPFYVNNPLLDAFEINDQRKLSWIEIDSISGKAYPYKYKNATQNSPITENLIVLRLAEQYLIRAEARIQNSNIVDGIEDLNILRARASKPAPDNLPALPIILSKEEALLKVEYERQVELFTEWGHRWLDLKRTDRVNTIMSSVTTAKGGTWNSNWQLYPLPANDIRLNPHLSQNQGY